MSDEDVKVELREIKQELRTFKREVDEMLKGKPYDRSDQGLIGDVHQLMAWMRTRLRWEAVIGGTLLTAGIGLGVTRIFG